MTIPPVTEWGTPLCVGPGIHIPMVCKSEKFARASLPSTPDHDLTFMTSAKRSETITKLSVQELEKRILGRIV